MVIITSVIGELPHTVCVAIETATVGFGFTVTETVVVDESQPLAVAFIVKTVVCTVLVVLVKLPEIEVPLPSGIPVILAVLVLVQL